MVQRTDEDAGLEIRRRIDRAEDVEASQHNDEAWNAPLRNSAGWARVASVMALARINQVKMDAGIEQAIEQTAAEPACRPGCNYCCYEKVAAYPYEIFLIADFIRSNWRLMRRKALMKRLRQASVHAETEPRAYFELQVPCPLLSDEGRCSVYSVRPTNCRRCHSYTPEACETACPDVVLNRWIMTAVAGQREFMGSVMTDLELQDEPVVFVESLLMALESPRLVLRWSAGEKVFRAWPEAPGATPAGA